MRKMIRYRVRNMNAARKYGRGPMSTGGILDKVRNFSVGDGYESREAARLAGATGNFWVFDVVSSFLLDGPFTTRDEAIDRARWYRETYND